LNGRQPIGEDDLRTVEDLLARYPGEERLRNLCTVAFMAAASQAHAARRLADAASLLRRASAVLPTALEPRALLLTVLLDAGDWAAAEAAARDLVARDGRNADALYGLAYALLRQDRNREAKEALQASLAIRDSAQARALLERIQKGLLDERNMTEQQLSHFHVRYDGDSHEDVGREILRVLERHYATLVRASISSPRRPSR